MSFFSSATEKQIAMTLTNRNLGRARLRKHQDQGGFCDDWLVKYDWLYLENGKMKCHPCINTRQNNLCIQHNRHSSVLHSVFCKQS